MMGNEGLVVRAQWPQPSMAVSKEILSAGTYLSNFSTVVAKELKNLSKKAAKGKQAADNSSPPNCVDVFVAVSFPEWKKITLEILRENFDAANNTIGKEAMAAIARHPELQSAKKVKPASIFAASVREEAKQSGASALALTMPFDEAHLIRSNTPYLLTCLAPLKIKFLHVHSADGDRPIPESAEPGRPALKVTHEASQALGEEGASEYAKVSGDSSKKLTMMEYLEKHNVAETLNALVNERATEQPADPWSWLSRKSGEKSCK